MRGRSLTDDQVREIRRRHAGGEAQGTLAREFGLDKAAMSRLIRRETYRTVPCGESRPCGTESG
jgi:hypothetical protein